MDFYYGETSEMAPADVTEGYSLTSNSSYAYDLSSVSSCGTKAELGSLGSPGRTSPGNDLGYHTLLTRTNVTSPPPPSGHQGLVVPVSHRSSFNSSSSSNTGWSPGVVPPFPAMMDLSAGLSPGHRVPLQDTEKLLATFKGKRTPRTSLFDKLTDDIILRIFSFLSSNQLCVCARVCRRWYFLAWEPVLWTHVNLSSDRIHVDRGLKTLFRLLCRDSPTVCLTVERIALNGCIRLTDKGLTTIARRCPELRSLDVRGCHHVTNAGVTEIASRCLNLERLDLTGCYYITSIQPRQHGGGGTSADSVSSDQQLPREVPSGPRQLYLQHLDLTDCHAVEDSSMKIIVRNCPQLTHLYLRRCVQVTDVGIKSLASYCVMLRELSVSDCVQITDFGMYELAKLGPNLRYLSVAKCDQISDAGIKQIARHCYKLRYLNVRGCEAVSDDSMEMLARSCPRLRALDIGKCDVSDQGLKLLSEHCPNLKKLSVKSCDMVTDKGIQAIAYYCRGLQQLNIQDCHVTIDGYRTVKKFCKRCIIEHTNPGFF